MTAADVPGKTGDARGVRVEGWHVGHLWGAVNRPRTPDARYLMRRKQAVGILCCLYENQRSWNPLTRALGTPRTVRMTLTWDSRACRVTAHGSIRAPYLAAAVALKDRIVALVAVGLAAVLATSAFGVPILVGVVTILPAMVLSDLRLL